MKLVELIERESTIPRGRWLALVVLAGFSNALILAIINAAAQKTQASEPSYRFFFLFLVVTAIYVVSQRYILVRSTADINNIVKKIQTRVADNIRHCELHGLERIGRSRIYAGISKETQALAQTAPLLVTALQSSVLVFFTVLYIAWLSLIAFALCAVFTGLALAFHFRRAREIQENLLLVATQENRLLDLLSSFLHGFKEIRLNSARSQDLYEHFENIATSVRDVRVKTFSQLGTHFVFSQTIFYVLMALMVFVAPRLSEAYSNEVVLKGTAAILFMVGPIITMVNAIPALANCNVSAANIVDLEEELERAVPKASGGRILKGFEEIQISGLTFTFDDPEAVNPFRVGPLNLTVKKGETLFIAGGNGSGKSTLLKLLTSLYGAEAGDIEVDGKSLSALDQQSYRSLFSAVFSDYHLFDRLYGMPEVDDEEARQALELLEIGRKTGVIDGEFDTLDLSNGQRKRVALAVSLLEDRPIIVLDEWAADQDPEFKRKFYEELLLELKRHGKTIVAVTHDDRYFGVADRLVRMEDGVLVADEAES